MSQIKRVFGYGLNNKTVVTELAKAKKLPTQKHIAEKRFGETINSDVVLCKLCLPSVSSIKQLI